MPNYEILTTDENVEDQMILKSETQVVTSRFSVSDLKREYAMICTQITLLKAKADLVVAQIKEISDSGLIEIKEIPGPVGITKAE